MPVRRRSLIPVPTDRQCGGRGSNPRPLSRKSVVLTIKLLYDTMRYGGLTCAQKLTRWPAQSSARHRNAKIRKNWKLKTKPSSSEETVRITWHTVPSEIFSARCWYAATCEFRERAGDWSVAVTSQRAHSGGGRCRDDGRPAAAVDQAVPGAVTVELGGRRPSEQLAAAARDRSARRRATSAAATARQRRLFDDDKLDCRADLRRRLHRPGRAEAGRKWRIHGRYYDF